MVAAQAKKNSSKKTDKNVNKGKRLPKVVNISTKGYNTRLNTQGTIDAIESKNGKQDAAAIIKGMELEQLAGEQVDTISVTNALKLTNALKTEIVSIENPTRAEIKDLVKTRMQLQHLRMAMANQARSIGQKYTQNNLDHIKPIIKWTLVNIANMEKDITNALKIICENSEVGRWLLSIKSVGPATAAACLGYLDVTGANYATKFISYAGLNDNNRPWLGLEKAKVIVNEVVGDAKEITPEMLEDISVKSKWSYDYLAKNGIPKNGKNWTKTALANAVAKIPYNADLKKALYIFSESVIKNTNPEALYPSLYRQRKVYEKTKNENGEYADYAKYMLETMNFSKDTVAKKAYLAGKLPDGHIDMRARRWMEKVFLCHVFEEMYRVQYNKKPPCYYPFEHLEGHHEYIPPEVPFTRQFEDD